MQNDHFDFANVLIDIFWCQFWQIFAVQYILLLLAGLRGKRAINILLNIFST